MYYIFVYDVDERKVAKVCKLLRKYLHWVQNSVFEGELTEGKFAELKFKLSKIIDIHLSAGGKIERLLDLIKIQLM